MNIFKGVNEVCTGKVCKFTYKSTEPLKKGQKLELQDRMSLGSDGSRTLTALEVNEEKLCEGLLTNKKGNYHHTFNLHLNHYFKITPASSSIIFCVHDNL